jgi:translocation and assembly module TamB
VAKGQARATAKLSGTLAAPVVSVSLFGEELEYSGSKLGGLELHVDTGPGGKLTGKGKWNTSPGALSAELQTPYTLKQLWNGLPSRQALMKAPLEGTAQLSGFNLAALSPWALPSASGLADGTVSLRGSLEAPLGTADVTARQLSIQGSSPIDASAKVQALANGVTVEFKSTHKASPLLELAASAEAPLGRFFEGPRAWANVPLRASGKAGPLSPTEWAGTWVKGQRRPTFPDGKLSVQFDAQGSLESPAVRVDGRFDEMKWGKAPLGRAEFSYGYDRRLSKAEAQFYSSSGNTLTATGTLDQDLSYDTWKQPLSLDGALNAAIRAEDFDISALNGIIPGFRSLAGRLSANGKATGTLSAPVLRARAELQNGQFAMDGYGQYRDVHLSAEADEGRFQLHELSGKSGSGDARLSADAVRKGGEFAVTAQLETKQFPIVFDDQLWAILDLRAQGEGTHVPGLLDFSRVTIPSARIELPEVKRKDLQPLMRPPDVFLWSDGQPMGRRRRGGSARGAAAASKPMEIRLALFAPKNLWLRGTDINTELGLSDGFRVEITDAVALHGRILFSDKGRISVLGKRFDIQRDSALSFGGPPQTPYINVTAVYVNEREGVKVLMTVVGQGKDLTLKPSSEPPLPENEIYTLLATGRRTLKRGSGSSLSQADAASVVGSAFAAQLKKTLAAKLPLDVLSIEAGDEGLSGTKVEAGTYVTDDVYVGYSGKLGPTTYRENSNAVRLEYQFAPHWSFETEFGDARVGGADLIWSRDF